METNYLFFLRNFAAKSSCIALFLILLTANFGGNILNAQVSAYSFSQSNGAYSSVNGATILGTATANSGAIPSLDSTSFPVTIPFGFVFNGQTYTDFNMSSNGYIAFGTVVDSGSTPISATTPYDGAISAWGKDINAIFDIVGKTGNMSFAIEGTAPNRVAIMQWENFRPSYTTSTTATYVFSFQIRLAETTNVISTVYSNGAYLVGSTGYSATNAQIGLRGATNADFNNRTNTGTVDFTSSTAGTANANGQSFSTTLSPPGMPTPGLTYTWTPPTCLIPGNITISNITTTAAFVNWTASTSAPANGYDVFVSTSNIPPTATSTPTVPGVTGTTITLTGLTPSTQYFVWIRSNCGAGDFSSWSNRLSFNTSCVAPAILTTTPGLFCAGQTATLAATADAGATIKWYAAATGGTALATGPSFTTPVLAAPTSYYVSAAAVSPIESVGPVSPSSLGTISASNYAIGTYYQQFDVITPTNLVSIDVFPASSVSIGTPSAVEIRDNTGATLISVPYTVAVNDGITPQTIILNYPLVAGTGYRIGQGQNLQINLQRNTSGTVYPITSSAITITGNNFDVSYWYYIYNWKFSSTCESARQTVSATLDPACPLSVENIDVQSSDINVYPNPVSSILYIKSKTNVIAMYVFSATGVRVLNSNGKNITSVNMDGLSTGVYMVNITLNNGQKITKKVIKK